MTTISGRAGSGQADSDRAGSSTDSASADSASTDSAITDSAGTARAGAAAAGRARSSTADYSTTDYARRVTEPAKSAVLPMAEHGTDRSEFSRDRARILHSGAFRRLAGKTQVVAPGEGDVPRTRLTHSLEVAQIARDMGAQLGCDPDLVDLAGLAHDIGHPPFGHNGEAALNEIADAIGGFEANAQNLRLLTRLEPKVIDSDGRCDGLNLTRASLDAVIKYPWPRPDTGGKFGVYGDDIAVFDWIRDSAPESQAKCLEAQVMDWADDVAYSVHDVEDGVMAGRIDLVVLANDADERAAVAEAASGTYSAESVGELADVLAELLHLEPVASRIAFTPGIAGVAALKQLTSELTGRFVTGAVARTRRDAGGRPVNRYGADLAVPRLLAAEVAVLKAIAFHYVMQDPGHRGLKQRQQEVLAELVEALLDGDGRSLDPVFMQRYHEAVDDAERRRVVIDQVAMLTDAQAWAWHRGLASRSASGESDLD